MDTMTINIINRSQDVLWREEFKRNLETMKDANTQKVT